MTSILSVCFTGRLASLANGALAFLAFVCLAVTSIIVTIVQKKATDVINQHGNDIGVYAYRGRKFLILTWVSTAAMLVSFIAWVVLVFKGRKDKTSRRDLEKSGPRVSGDTVVAEEDRRRSHRI